MTEIAPQGNRGRHDPQKPGLIPNRRRHSELIKTVILRKKHTGDMHGIATSGLGSVLACTQKIITATKDHAVDVEHARAMRQGTPVGIFNDHRIEIALKTDVVMVAEIADKVPQSVGVG